MTLAVQFLWWEECPSHAAAWERLQRALAEEGVPAKVERIEVRTDADAARWRFPGSPTIRVNGQDIDPAGEAQPSRLTCRLYFTAEGRPTPLPPVDLIRRSLRATAPVAPSEGASDA